MPHIQVKDGTTPGPIRFLGVPVKATSGYTFNLFDDRIALLLGGKDFFSVKRVDINLMLVEGNDGGVIEIYDYRHGKGFPPFNFSFDGTALSLAEHVFDRENGARIREWAQLPF